MKINTPSFNLNSTRANIAWATSLQVIEKLTGYVILALMTRTFLKEDLGAMFFAISVAGMTAIALNFGTDTYLVRRVAGDPDHELAHFSSVLSIRIINVMGGYVLLNLATWFIQPELSPIMLLVIAYDFLEEIYHAFAAFFVAKKKIIYRLLTLGIFKILSLCVISLVAYMSNTLLSILWAQLLLNGALVWLTFIVFQKNFGKIYFRWNLKANIEILKLSMPFFLVNGLTLIHMRFDTIMVGAMLGFQQLANYELSIKLVEVARFVVRPLNTVFLPIFVEYTINAQWHKLRLRFFQLVVSVFLVGIVLMAGMQAIGLQVIGFLFGTNYIESAAPARILFISVPFLYAGMIVIAVANALHMERRTVIILFFAVLINLGLNFFAIPNYGIIGAAWVTVISQVLLTIGMFVFILPGLFHPPQVLLATDPQPELINIEDVA